MRERQKTDSESLAVTCDDKTSARELAAKFGIDPLTEGEHRKNLFVAGLRHGRAKDFLRRKESAK